MNTHYQNAISDAEKYEFDYTENGVRKCPLGGKSQSIRFGVAYQDWDFVSLQQVSTQSGIASTYNKVLDELVNFIKGINPDVKFIWNMTWTYKVGYSPLNNYGGTPEKMYAAITSTVQSKIETHPDFCGVNPAGTAIQNAKTSYLTDDDIHRDELHLSWNLGRYIAGLTMFCTLTGYTPAEVTYVPDGISTQDVAVAKECVQNALNNKYQVTNSQYTA